jgi:hypothetical protein
VNDDTRKELDDHQQEAELAYKLKSTYKALYKIALHGRQEFSTLSNASRYFREDTIFRTMY